MTREEMLAKLIELIDPIEKLMRIPLFLSQMILIHLHCSV